MTIVVPTPADLLPTPPTTADPASFDSRMDATLLAQQAMVPQVNQLAQDTYTNAQDASASATAASGSASAAAISASSALSSKNTAEAAGTAAVQAFDDFDRRYLGAKASAPTLDNDGNPLQSGALFFLIGTGMRAWTGAAWEAAYLPSSGYQETLVSGTNIKTFGGQSILGSGDLPAPVGAVPIVGSIFAGFTSPDYTDSLGGKWLRLGFSIPINPTAETALAPYGALTYQQFAPRTLPVSANWYSATYGNGVFVAVAQSSAIAATSPDGVTWTQRALPVSANWYSATYGNGVFVAVAQSSAIAATSPNPTANQAMSWGTAATSGGLPQFVRYA
jgi:hypothetical protein